MAASAVEEEEEEKNSDGDAGESGLLPDAQLLKADLEFVRRERREYRSIRHSRSTEDQKRKGIKQEANSSPLLFVSLSFFLSFFPMHTHTYTLI